MQKVSTWGHWKIKASLLGRRVKPEETHPGVRFPFSLFSLLALSQEKAPKRAVRVAPLTGQTRGKWGKSYEIKNPKRPGQKELLEARACWGFLFPLFHGVSPVSPQLSVVASMPAVKIDQNPGFLDRKSEKSPCSLKSVRIIPIFLHSVSWGALSCGNCTAVVVELKFQEKPHVSGQRRAKDTVGQGGHRERRELETGVLSFCCH